MLQRLLIARSVRLTFGAGFLWLICGATASAQSINDGMDALNQAYHRNRDLIGSLFKADTILDPSRPQEVEAVDVAAKLATYPMVFPSEVNPAKPGDIDNHFRKHFETDLTYILRYKVKSPELGKVYAEKVQQRGLEVYNYNPNNIKPVIRINIARMLANLAQFGRPELADALVDLLNDPPPRGNDAVRYWALKGLHDLLSQMDADGKPILDQDHTNKVANALVQFLERRVTFALTAPSDEVEGYRLLRREAVRALAQVRQPQISPKARPAAVLARFVADDVRFRTQARPQEQGEGGPDMAGDMGDMGGAEGGAPPDAGAGDFGGGRRGGRRGGMGGRGRGGHNLGPRLDERLEAAIGLARMRPGKESPGYQADYVAEQIAHFINSFGARATENGNASGKEREQPWRIDAARLADAMEEMKKIQAKDAFVVQVADAALRVLRPLERGDQAPPADLTFLGECTAPNREVFKGHPDTAVQPMPAGPGGGFGGRRGGRGGGDGGR